MALTYKLVSPNGNTTITLLAQEVTGAWNRQVRSNRLIELRERLFRTAKREKKWVIIAEVLEVSGETTPSGSGQAILEELETAVESWANQSSGAGGGRFTGESKLILGKDSSGSDWEKFGVIEGITARWSPSRADDEVVVRSVTLTFREGDVIL